MNADNELKREYLMRYLSAKKRYNRADELLRETLTVGPSAIIYDDMPHGTPDSTGLENFAIKADKQLEAVRRAGAECQRIRDEVNAVINALGNETQIDVMFYRYILYQRTPYETAHNLEGTRQLTWEEIADRLSYSLDRVAHIHGEALARLEIPRADMD